MRTLARGLGRTWEMTKGELGEAGRPGGDCVCRLGFGTQGMLAPWRWLFSKGFLSGLLVFFFLLFGASCHLAFRHMDFIGRLCCGGPGVLGHGAGFPGQFSTESEQFSLISDLLCRYCYIVVR